MENEADDDILSAVLVDLKENLDSAKIDLVVGFKE